MEIIRQHTDCRKDKTTEQMIVDTVALLHIFGHHIVLTIRTNDDGNSKNEYRMALDTPKISEAISKYNTLVENPDKR